MRWLPLILLLLLSACGSTPTHYFVLTPDATHPAAGAMPGLSLEINMLRLPKYLDRPQIVSHSSNNELVLAEHAQWGGKLRDNMMRLLARNLGDALGTTQIAIAPYRPSEPAMVRVMVEVLRFERMADGVVQLDAQWRLIDGRSGRTLVARISRLHGAGKVDGWEETTRSMSRVFGRFSREIAREIRRRFHAPSG
ncbi:MAG: membrane integrity-associated transporter subunit PqiC [Zetaproteobacteria bacterium]|nr:MAG: membrane integrity-associated transporter subunit PqiC [Zetaproteobacteria bacterium]